LIFGNLYIYFSDFYRLCTDGTWDEDENTPVRTTVTGDGGYGFLVQWL